MIVVLAVVFLALHLPYLPRSLEDLDSINFALGVRRFDVAHHQPHPPGYPVYIAIAKLVHAAVPAEAAALGLVSVAAGALGVLALAALYRRLDEADTPLSWRVAPIAVAMTAPLYWFTAVRPLSDGAGLAAAIAVQAMTLAAGGTRALAIAAFSAGLATGLRSQVLWLTVPLLALRALEGVGVRGWGLGGRRAEGDALTPNPRSLIPVLSAFAAGVLIWFVPLVLLTGGPTVYWHALLDQGAEDLGNIQMLWNRHGAGDVRDALYYAFAAPWASWPVAAVALACAVLGIVSLARRRRRVLLVLAAAFGPYLIFDLLFQETFTSRYALPLVVPMAYLAVAGLRLVPRDLGLAVAVPLVVFSAHVGGTSVAAYSRAAAPVFRMLEAMRAQPVIEPAPVLAPDRRESFDLRGPRKLLGDAMPKTSQMLAAPPQHEWLEAVKYWNGGGRAPLWFVVDPLRASMDLIQHGEPERYRWPLPYPVLLSGARPNEMDWYRVERPEWYVGEGWSLTPEAAGVAAADRRGLAHGPIAAWIDRSASGGTLMIGGRNFEPTQRPRLAVALAGVVRDDTVLPPGPFLRFIHLPIVEADRPSDTCNVSVAASPASHVAIEQFDVSATRPLIGFGAGWHELELNPRTGVRWRWLSERGDLHVRAPAGRLTLHLDGESPRTYFPRGSRLIVRSGDRVVFDELLTADFSRDIAIANPADAIVLETDQTYVPAERSGRTQDRRRLGLRLFRIAAF